VILKGKAQFRCFLGAFRGTEGGLNGFSEIHLFVRQNTHHETRLRSLIVLLRIPVVPLLFVLLRMLLVLVPTVGRHAFPSDDKT